MKWKAWEALEPRAMLKSRKGVFLGVRAGGICRRVGRMEGTSHGIYRRFKKRESSAIGKGRKARVGAELITRHSAEV